MDAITELQTLTRIWERRLNAVKKANEPVLYVTHSEWRSIKRMEELRALTEPPKVTEAKRLQSTLMSGAIGNLLATPVVIDVAKQSEQRTRLELDDAPVTD